MKRRRGMKQNNPRRRRGMNERYLNRKRGMSAARSEARMNEKARNLRGREEQAASGYQYLWQVVVGGRVLQHHCSLRCRRLDRYRFRHRRHLPLQPSFISIVTIFQARNTYHVFIFIAFILLVASTERQSTGLIRRFVPLSILSLAHQGPLKNRTECWWR